MLAIILSAALSASATAPPAGASPSTPQPDATQERFTRDRERGWHWYEERPEPKPPELAKPPTPANPVAPQEQKPPVMSARWLKEEFERATEIAISEPTAVNVEYWAYLRKLMLDKSEKFATMAAMVTTANPVLDETIENPVNSMAIDARRNVRDVERERVLDAISQKTSLVYFHREDCAYCERMTPVIEKLKSELNLQITGVAMDGKPMGSNIATSWMPDRGQAAMLGVTSTPTFYLFGETAKGRELMRVGIGATTYTDLTTKILRAARQAEWITQADLEVALLGAERNLFIDRVNSGIDWTDPAQALNGLKALEQVAVDRADENVMDTGASTPIGNGE